MVSSAATIAEDAAKGENGIGMAGLASVLTTLDKRARFRL
jgi:hypothetical protein